jgi:hypothetical protein
MITWIGARACDALSAVGAVPYSIKDDIRVYRNRTNASK